MVAALSVIIILAQLAYLESPSCVLAAALVALVALALHVASIGICLRELVRRRIATTPHVAAKACKREGWRLPEE